MKHRIDALHRRWLVSLFAALLVLGGCGDSGGFDPVQVARGRDVHRRQACHACHPLDGTSGAGPAYSSSDGDSVTLVDGHRVARDAAYLRRAIIEPQAELVMGYGPTMPGYADRLAPSELEALVVFLQQAYSR